MSKKEKPNSKCEQIKKEHERVEVIFLQIKHKKASTQKRVGRDEPRLSSLDLTSCLCFKCSA